MNIVYVGHVWERWFGLRRQLIGMHRGQMVLCYSLTVFGFVFYWFSA